MPRQSLPAKELTAVTPATQQAEVWPRLSCSSDFFLAYPTGLLGQTTSSFNVCHGKKPRAYSSDRGRSMYGGELAFQSSTNVP